MWSVFVTFGKPQANDCAHQVIAEEAFLEKGRGSVWLEKKKTKKTAAALRITLPF